jgi:pyridinium-3,5-bisthiocarboxylic acid mononucleotide nickel chelatase
LLSETTTLGVRYRNEQREILRREFATVETEYGSIRIKIARARDGRILNASPEFEDCRAAAETHATTLRLIQLAAANAYQNSRG